MNLLVIILILIFGIQCVYSQNHGSTTIYVPLYGTYKLKCQNKTDGIFSSVVWMTNAYSNAKQTVYSYESTKKETMNKHFTNRITRYGGTSIAIKNAQLKDSGNWECNLLFLYTPRGEPSRLRVNVPAVYDVVVVSPPVITKIFPRSSLIQQSKRLSIYCDAKASSPFNITWTKIDGHISYKVKINAWDKKKMDGTYTMRSTMTFERFDIDDVGEYLCVSQNIGGIVEAKTTIKLKVLPSITMKRRVTANTGKSISLECNSTGYPTVAFTWKFASKGRNVSLQQQGWFSRFEVSVTNYGEKVASSKLHIFNIEKADWQVYTCIAKNAVGSDVKQIRLVGYSIPEPPNELRANEITDSYVFLSWVLPHSRGKTIKSIKIEYKQSKEVDWSKIEVSRALTQYTFMNLIPGTYYDFRVCSTNDIGQSDHSEIFTVETEFKEKPKISSSKDNSIIFGLGIIALTGICGGVLLGLTCFISCCCLLKQERRMKKKRKQKNKENNEENERLQMNDYS